MSPLVDGTGQEIVLPGGGEGEIKIVEQATISPSACFATGSTEGPLLDLGRSALYTGGHLYLHIPYLRMLNERIGPVEGDETELEELQRENAELMAENAMLKAGAEVIELRPKVVA